MRGDTRPSGRVGAKTGGRIGFAEGTKQFGDSEYYKQKEKRKQAREVRDVERKVIPDRGPHTTYQGKMGERRRGYLRKNKMLPGMKNDPNRRIQIKPKMSAEQRKLRDNLASVTGGEWGKKRGGKV